MTIEDTIPNTQERKLTMEEKLDASEELVNKLEKEINKLGYRVNGYGSGFKRIDGVTTPTITINVAYKSILKVFYNIGPKRAQEKVKALVPETHSYNGKDIPVELGFIISSRFL